MQVAAPWVWSGLALLGGCYPLGSITGTFGGPVDADEDGVRSTMDCDDGDPDRFPGATERCDGIDNDCNGLIDDKPIDPLVFYEDNDGDGYGTDRTVLACSRPTGFAAQAGDCDDERNVVYPTAPERCDALDNDCDEVVDINVVPRDHATINEALAAVDPLASFTEICVNPGSYREPITVVAPQRVGLIASNGPDVTTFELPSSSPFVTFEGNEEGAGEIAVEGFTITGLQTSADIAGGFLSATDGTVTLRNLVFKEHRIDGGTTAGMLLLGHNLTLTVDNVLIDDVVATLGDETDLTGMLISVEQSDVVIDGLTARNLAVTTPTGPAHCSLQGTVLRLVQGRAQVNRLLIEDVGVDLDCVGHANTDGLLVRAAQTDLSGHSWTLQGVSLTGRAPQIGDPGTAVGHAGGVVGLDLAGPDQTLDRVDVLDNDVSWSLNQLGPQVTGLFRTRGGRLTLTHFVARRNHVDLQVAESTPFSGVTGGVLNAEARTVRWLDIRGTTVTGNSIVEGVGAYFASPELELENAIFAGNRSVSTDRSKGGGLFAQQQGNDILRMRNCDFIGNSLTMGERGEGGGFNVQVGGSVIGKPWLDLANVNLSDNVVAGSAFAEGSAFVAVSDSIDFVFSNMHGNQGGDDTLGPASDQVDQILDVPPGFQDLTSTDPADWDLTLASDSSLSDAGDPAILDADGSRSDIGAYGGPNGDGW